MKFRNSLFILLLCAIGVSSCVEEATIETTPQKAEIQNVNLEPVQFDFSAEHLDADLKKRFLDHLSGVSRSGGLDVTLEMAEYITTGESDEMGRTVFFSDRGNRQLAVDFLGGDPRSLGGDQTVYAIDNTDGATASGLSAGTTEAAIDRAMATWNGVRCSDLMMAKNGAASNTDFGFVQALFGFGGDLNSFYGDVQHAGWLPGAFFDFLAPGGSNFILGVTFTLTWNQDLNGDGEAEVAFREIYYNDNFPWADGSTYDVETVALHEAGHGLSQAHFGEAFRSGGNNKLHFAPRAVMNAAYSGVQTRITATDNGGHCSIWGNWPNN